MRLPGRRDRTESTLKACTELGKLRLVLGLFLPHPGDDLLGCFGKKRLTRQLPM
jgi:hypothetical protein